MLSLSDYDERQKARRSSQQEATQETSLARAKNESKKQRHPPPIKFSDDRGHGTRGGCWDKKGKGIERNKGRKASFCVGRPSFLVVGLEGRITQGKLEPRKKI